MHNDPDPAHLGRRAFFGMAAVAGVGMTASGQSAAAHPVAHVPELCSLEAVSLSAAIHSKRVSCVEVMSAHLDHIERINPKVNAIVELQDRALLLKQARERDAQLSRGVSMGALHGFPHAVKDLEDVKGIRTSHGSPIFKDFVAMQDGLMVERLRAGGAIFIGKTNVPEFGLGSHTYNPVYGATRNAYDAQSSAGGSSGGAAVALALRMVPLADGSDFGGSLRNPAGWNNVCGFRTSVGCVPFRSNDLWIPSMSVLGPMARNVPDLAMLLSVQAGYAREVPFSMLQAGSRFSQRLERDFKGARIGWCGDFGGQVPYEPEVLAICEAALPAFEALGCSVEPAAPAFPVEAAWKALLTLRALQSGGALAEHYRDPARRALLKPEAIYEIEAALPLTALQVSAASAVRTRWSQSVQQLFEHFDYLLVPSAQVLPFALEQHWPQQIAGHSMQTYHEWMKGTFLITMAGCPALAMPAGFSGSGLPMGLQLIAPLHEEFACLQLAHAYGLASSHAARLPPVLRGPT